MRKFPILFGLLFIAFQQLFAQGEIPVNMYTGTPNIEVPIVNLVSHDLADRISLAYQAGGVKVSDKDGPFGVSWSLRGAGGAVTREVRGLPDDFAGIGNDHRRGWLYQQYGTTTYLNADVATVPNTSDLLASTCADEQADYARINGYGYYADTEPDLFYYTAGDVSGSFVFDNTSGTPEVRLIPYQEVKIVPVFFTGSKEIIGFVIKNNMGAVYTFGIGATESRYTEKLPLESTVEFLKTAYELYARANHNNASVTYTTSWNLKTSVSASGDKISYSYTSLSVPQTTSRTIKVSLFNNTPQGGYSTYGVYTDNISVGGQSMLYGIDTESGPGVRFLYTEGLVSSIYITDKRGGRNYATVDTVKQVDISYITSGTRHAIQSIQERSGTEVMPPYWFDYYGYYLPFLQGEDFWGYSNGPGTEDMIPQMYVYPDLAPADRFRFERISGYSGRELILAGANRQVNPQALVAGTLKTISYPFGGAATFTYEPRQYFDSVANQNFNGGGLRIKSISYNDGLNLNVKIEKSFSYVDASGRSTGRLVQKPVFAMLSWKYKDPTGSAEISFPDDEGSWYSFVVRTPRSIVSPALTEGSAVGYKEVKVIRPGSGYAHYEYEMRAADGIKEAAPFSSPQNKFARGPECIDMHTAADAVGYNTFPYAPAPEFDYERGLLRRKREYNEQGNLVREESHTYQYLYRPGSLAPYKVWGLKSEKFPNTDVNVYLFGKYFLLTDVAKVPDKDVFITYEGGQSITQSEETFYESLYHRMPTRTEKTSSENTKYQTYRKYPLDYGAIPTNADKASGCIGALQSDNLHGIAVETYRTEKKVAGSELVTGGSVLKFHDFGVAGKVLLQHSYAWTAIEPKPLSVFRPSFINATTGAFTMDDSYRLISTVQEYAAFDKPRVTRGIDRMLRFTNWAYNQSVPSLQVQQANPGTFAFSDFEVSTDVSFDMSCTVCDPGYTALVPGGNSGQSAIDPRETKLSKQISKGNNLYRLAGWWNQSAEFLRITVTVKNTAKTVTYYNQTIEIPRTRATGYQYFERSIDVSAAPQDFYIEIVFLPLPFTNPPEIDNVWFGPSEAQYSYQTYIFPHGVQSSGSGNRIQSTVYDVFGRIKYQKDHNKDIIQKKSYQFTN